MVGGGVLWGVGSGRHTPPRTPPYTAASARSRPQPLPPTPAPPEPKAAAQPAPPSPPGPDWSVPPRYRGKLLYLRPRGFDRKIIALTFDDGPDPGLTPSVLKTLAAHQAHATFFVQGKQVKAHPEVLGQVLAAGHAIGNHSYSHPARPTATQAAIQLQRTDNLVRKWAGRRPTCFRPPYGITAGHLARLACGRQDAVVLWTLNSRDAEGFDSVSVTQRVRALAHPGDIVLMHDGSGHLGTAKALPKIMDGLAAKGYAFVTVPELLREWDRFVSAQVIREGRARTAPAKPPHAAAP